MTFPLAQPETRLARLLRQRDSLRDYIKNHGHVMSPAERAAIDARMAEVEERLEAAARETDK